MGKASYETPQDTPRHHLERAIELVGGQSALARACGIKQGHVWAWLNKTSKCPAEHVLSIEEATGGTVTRHQLRPDLYPDSISRAESPPMPPKPTSPTKTSSRKKTPKKSGGKKGKLKVRGKTKISVAGKKAKRKALKVGMSCTFKVKGVESALAISC